VFTWIECKKPLLKSSATASLRSAMTTTTPITTMTKIFNRNIPKFRIEDVKINSMIKFKTGITSQNRSRRTGKIGRWAGLEID